MWFTGVPQNVAHQHHPSIGGSATVSQQFQGIIVRGSSSGSAIAGASGFRAGAGGGSAGATIHVNSDCQQATSAESGKPGLLRWSYLLKTFRGGADEFQSIVGRKSDLPPCVACPQLQGGVSETKWLSSGHGFITGPWISPLAFRFA